MSHGFARSGEVDIAYSVDGRGKQAVLLVMGLGQRAADWGARFPAALAEHYRVVRFDNRGTGRSGFAGGGFTLEDMARDAVAVMNEVGLEKAHVIGLSMGGMITQLLALDHAERVDSIVLMSTHFGGATVVGPTPEAMVLFAPEEYARVGGSPEAMMRRTASVITAPGFAERDPATVEFLASCAGREPTPPSVFMAQIQAIIASDRAHRLGDISARTLVVHGTEDSLIPVANGEALASRIPGAELVLVDDCGHFPMLEKPGEVTRAVLDFLSAAS